MSFTKKARQLPGGHGFEGSLAFGYLSKTIRLTALNCPASIL